MPVRMNHPNRRLQLDAEFDQFIADNPQVYDQFRKIAVKLKVKGFDRWGAKAIWEVLRYELAVNTTANVKDYKLNNNYTSRMARKLMNEEPEDFGDFFELRKLKTDTEPLIFTKTPAPLFRG